MTTKEIQQTMLTFYLLALEAGKGMEGIEFYDMLQDLYLNCGLCYAMLNHLPEETKDQSYTPDWLEPYLLGKAAWLDSIPTPLASKKENVRRLQVRVDVLNKILKEG